MNKLAILFIMVFFLVITSFNKEVAVQPCSDLLGIETYKVYTIDVTVTGYSSTKDQCDNDPFITASNKKVRKGYIALSRDLLYKFNKDAPFKWGDEIYIIINGSRHGPFVVEDTMNKRLTNRADIWFTSYNEAINWGKKKGKIIY